MKSNSYFLLLTSFLLLVSLHARAQQEPASPQPSDSQSNESSGTVQDSRDRQTTDPDNRPLSGAQDLSPGIPQISKRVLDASLGVQQRLNATTSANSYRWNAENDVWGTLLWNRNWHRNSLLLHYTGGTLYGGNDYFQSIQTFDISQLLVFGRWSVNISNQAIYSPESSFGLPALEVLAANFFGTNPALLPNQTVLTGRTSRLSDGAVGQLEYAVSRRTALTMTGSYSLLHFTSTSLFDNTLKGATLGYDYLVTPRNTVALTYGYQQLEYSLFNNKLDINSATLGFAHQVPSRFTLQLEGGVQLTKSFGPGSLPRSSVRPDARVVLTSVWSRTQFRLSASKAVVSGAGFSVATNTTTASLSAERKLSRTWTSTINVGYASNSLIGLNFKLQTGFAQANLEKTMGQHLKVSLLYNFQRQAGDEFCALSLCAGEYLRHSVGIGARWQFRPAGYR